MKKLNKKFRVEPYKESNANLPEDILREIPKQDNAVHVEIEPIMEGIKPEGVEVTVRGIY